MKIRLEFTDGTIIENDAIAITVNEQEDFIDIYDGEDLEESWSYEFSKILNITVMGKDMVN